MITTPKNINSGFDRIEYLKFLIYKYAESKNKTDKTNKNEFLTKIEDMGPACSKMEHDAVLNIISNLNENHILSKDGVYKIVEKFQLQSFPNIIY